MASLDNLSKRERNLPRRQKRKLPPHYYYSISFFSKVCKELGKLNEGQLIYALNTLKNTESGIKTKVGEPYIFTNIDLFSTLLQVGHCKSICEERKYTSWDDIITAFSI